MKILIVEDELIIAEYMKGILEDEGHEVLSPVRNYTEAIDSYNSNNPDLVLLDIHLSDEISGFKVAQKIKESSNTAIVLVSGNTSKGFVQEAKDLNPNGFLSKPVKPIDLLLAVELAYNSFIKNSEMNNKIATLASRSVISEHAFMLKSFIHDLMNPVASLRHELTRSKSLEESEKVSLKDKLDLVIDILKSFRSAVKDSGEKSETLSIASICKKIDLINRYHCISRNVDLMITSTDGEVQGSESALIRIFSNLINNSLDALSHVEDEDKWIDISFVRVGDKIKAMITDSGNGIAKDVVDKLFQESFSTKKVSERAGSGIGLFSARETLKQNGHEIHYNEKAGNTQFVIDFNS